MCSREHEPVHFRMDVHFVESRVFIDLSHQAPLFSAVCAFVDTSFTPFVPKRPVSGHINGLWIFRMKADHADVFARSQPHIFPGLAAIAALVYSIAVGHTSLVIVLAGAHPDLVAVVRIDGHTSRGKTLLSVEDWRPARRVVRGLPDTRRGRGQINDVAVLRVHSHICDPA